MGHEYYLMEDNKHIANFYTSTRLQWSMSRLRAKHPNCTYTSKKVYNNIPLDEIAPLRRAELNFCLQKNIESILKQYGKNTANYPDDVDQLSINFAECIISQMKNFNEL